MHMYIYICVCSVVSSSNRSLRFSSDSSGTDAVFKSTYEILVYLMNQSPIDYIREWRWCVWKRHPVLNLHLPFFSTRIIQKIIHKVPLPIFWFWKETKSSADFLTPLPIRIWWHPKRSFPNFGSLLLKECSISTSSVYVPCVTVGVAASATLRLCVCCSRDGVAVVCFMCCSSRCSFCRSHARRPIHVRVVWHTHMCDMTHLYVGYDSNRKFDVWGSSRESSQDVRHDHVYTYTCVTWPMYIQIEVKCMRLQHRVVSTCVTWLMYIHIYMCDMTHVYTYTCVTWFMYTQIEVRYVRL